MKVTISVQGRFHLFNQAQQLLKASHLQRLITSYPKFEVVKYGIPTDKVRSIVIKEILERSWTNLPPFLRRIYNPQFFISELFDKLASHKIPDCDIFVGMPSVMLNSLRVARSRGAVVVAEHGSSHILFQKAILEEEYNRFGVKNPQFQLPHPMVVEKELREIDEADYISAPSSFVIRTLLSNGVSRQKIVHIPYGVDLTSFGKTPKQDDVFRVIFVGGMSLRKGVHYLLKAFSELKLPNSELMLVGSLTDEIKPFFRKYDGEFKWIGAVPQKELYRYYSHGSVFVLMSIEEGLAMVQAQAMACGLPVICTTNTGGEDIVRDGVDGFVIPIRSVEVLKEKLVYLYGNKSVREEMGQSAQNRVSSGFSWDDYGRKVIDFYLGVLNKI